MPAIVCLPPWISRAHVGRCGAEAAAEGAVEIGEVPETRLDRNPADRVIGEPLVAQQTMGAGQPLCEYELRERGGFGLEQFADVDRRYAVTHRERLKRQGPVAQAAPNISLDCLQASRAHPAPLGRLSGIAGGAKRCI